MKILLLGDYQEGEIFTGPQKYGKRIAVNLAKVHQITFVAYFRDGTRYSLWDKLFGKKIIQQEQDIQVYRFGIIQLIIFLLKNSYDIIHMVSFERFARIIFWFHLKKNAKIVYTAHTLFNYEYANFREYTPVKLQQLNSAIENQYFKLCDNVVSVSNYLKMLLIKNKRLSNNCEVIYNGVDAEFIRTSKSINAPKKNISLVFIGDITRKEKGFFILESALLQCSLSFDLFIISGSSKDLNLPKSISPKFINRLDAEKLALFLSDKDIVVTPSLYDSFSISTLEAMACGCVPIVSDSTGIAELIIAEMPENVVQTNNEMLLLKRIETLYNDSELRINQSIIAKNIASRFEWIQIANQYNRVYEKMLN
jgi:glycosyltransferase involved in cell wall biosynthesis